MQAPIARNAARADHARPHLQVGLNVVALEHHEAAALPDQRDRAVGVCELALVEARRQRAQAVEDQLLRGGARERLVVLLQVRLGRLRTA